MRCREVGPARRQVAVRLRHANLGRLATKLDRVPRIGERDDLVATDQELPRRARDLLLALGEREPGEIAHVLGPDAEVRIDPGAGEACPQPRQAGGSGGDVGRGPILQSRRVGRRREIGRYRPVTH